MEEETDDPRKQEVRGQKLCPQGMALSPVPPGTSDSWQLTKAQRESGRGLGGGTGWDSYSGPSEHLPCPSIRTSQAGSTLAGSPRPPLASDSPSHLHQPPYPTAHPEAGITTNPGQTRNGGSEQVCTLIKCIQLFRTDWEEKPDPWTSRPGFVYNSLVG